MAVPGSYYNSAPGKREAEVFANLVSMMGESEFTSGMVKHFHPNLHAYMLDQLAKVKALP